MSFEKVFSEEENSCDVFKKKFFTPYIAWVYFSLYYFDEVIYDKKFYERLSEYNVEGLCKFMNQPKYSINYYVTDLN